MSEIALLVDSLFSRPESEGQTLALLIQQHGEVIAERYGTQAANDFQSALNLDAGSTLISWSMAKSVTHAAVGILVADGLLDIDAPAPVDAWAGTPKAEITMLQLLEMRSGLHFIEDYIDGETSNCLEMLFGDSGPSHAEYAASQPLIHEPGTKWSYSSGTTNIVARIIGDIVNGSAGGDPAKREAAMRAFLTARLFGPAGMASAEPKFDGAGDFVGSSYVYASARDFMQFGELYRHDGVADLGNGERILPPGWTAHAAHQIAIDNETGYGYGRHWWTWPDFLGSYSCHGYAGQFIVVIPNAEIVLVHLGQTDISVAPALRARLKAMLWTLSGSGRN
jgi:CubicO group peptidase (beta-lactamase class C family)